MSKAGLCVPPILVEGLMELQLFTEKYFYYVICLLMAVSFINNAGFGQGVAQEG